MRTPATALNKLAFALCLSALCGLAAAQEPTPESAPIQATPAQSAPADPAPAPAPEKPVLKKTADGMTITESGLMFLDTAVGKGEAAQVGDMVWVHYTGWLQTPDGKKGKRFDSSLDRHKPLSFKLGAHQVINGWDEGVQGLMIHSKRRLVIPPNLAYGEKGAGKGIIPPNSTLIFEVELMKIAH